MSNRRLARVVGALFMAGFFGTALAGEVSTLGPLEIDTSWCRASVGTARPGAAYVTIRNTGDEPDRLVAIETPVAARPEVHEMEEEGGVMKMPQRSRLRSRRAARSASSRAACTSLLMQLRQPLEEGESIPITFAFRRPARSP
jgi:copper(I)-binding protein